MQKKLQNYQWISRPKSVNQLNIKPNTQVKSRLNQNFLTQCGSSNAHASRNQNLIIKRNQPLKNPKEQLYTNENFFATVGLGPSLTSAVRGGLYCYDSVTSFVCFEFCFVIASIINRLLFCSAKWNRSIIADYSCMLVVFFLFCVNQFYRKRTE